MVKHTQTIRRQKPKICQILSSFKFLIIVICNETKRFDHIGNMSKCHGIFTENFTIKRVKI